VRTSGGDFNETELADAVDNPYRNLLVAKAYQEHCAGRQAIGFGVNIAHSVHLAEAFISLGINAEAVWGADPDRADKVQRFRDGEIEVLFNPQLLVEGFDLATIACVILAGPTKSKVVFSQRVGRGTRLNPPLKNDCIVLDVCDASGRHSLVTLPTLLGLPSGLNMRGRSLVGTAKAIEDILEKYPHLDFTTLKDADKIEAFVESVNLFEVKVPPELEAASQFTWHPSISGGYVLMLPEKESRIQSVKIEQNLLDKWQIKAYLKGKRYAGQRDTMEEAFSAADDLVRKIVPESLTVVRREAEWHSLPPTKGQLWKLKRLYKGKQIPKDLNRGTASSLIGSALAGKW
jgi:ATP-dependent helicase IRC3